MRPLDLAPPESRAKINPFSLCLGYLITVIKKWTDTDASSVRGSKMKNLKKHRVWISM
jgi:hypothetical protein